MSEEEQLAQLVKEAGQGCGSEEIRRVLSQPWRHFGNDITAGLLNMSAGFFTIVSMPRSFAMIPQDVGFMKKGAVYNIYDISGVVDRDNYEDLESVFKIRDSSTTYKFRIKVGLLYFINP